MTTLLYPASAASSLAQLGECWTLRFSTRDGDGNLTASVTPVVTLTKPDASTIAPTVVADADFGYWLVRYTTAALGRHVAHVSTPDDALDMATYVNGPTTESGMPVVADVANYLGSSASSWSTQDMQEELDSERSAQRAKCGERAVYPPDLRRALMRRVMRALAFRRLPLAVQVSDADGGNLILPGRDPEVRRLEGPYRRLVVG